MDKGDTDFRRVAGAWRCVGDDILHLGRRAASSASAEYAAVAADGLGRPAAALRAGVGELGTGLAEDGMAHRLAREFEAAAKVSLEAAGGALSRLSARLRDLDEI